MLPRSEFSFDSSETVDGDPCAPPPEQPEQLFHYNMTLGIEQKLRKYRYNNLVCLVHNLWIIHMVFHFVCV